MYIHPGEQDFFCSLGHIDDFYYACCVTNEIMEKLIERCNNLVIIHTIIIENV